MGVRVRTAQNGSRGVLLYRLLFTLFPSRFLRASSHAVERLWPSGRLSFPAAEHLGHSQRFMVTSNSVA